MQNTGIKILKYSADSLILNELKIREDLRHSLEIFVIERLESASRHSHMELKCKSGNEYEAQYPNYEKVLVNFTNCKKEAEKRLNIVKHQSNKNKEIEVKIERNES